MANAAEARAAEAAAKFECGGVGGAAAAPSVGALEMEDPLERRFREMEGR